MKHFRRHSPAEWWSLVTRSVSAWSNDYAPSMGAALSYYSVFSMAPLLLIVISIAGLVFGQEAARGELFGELRSLMGADAAQGVESMLAALSKPSHGVTATVISVVVLVIGATSVFGELQDALDRIWHAAGRDKAGGLWGLLRSRFLSFGMVLGIAFLLMVSLVLTAAVSALGKWWGGFFGSWEVPLQIVNLVVGFGLTTTVFAMIYKLMPRVAVRWPDVWWGAAITALLFTVGKFLIGLYIGKSGTASAFGAAGGVAIIFVWVYYSAQIFLLGAEFTWVYASTFGSMKNAVVSRDEKGVEPVVPRPVGASGFSGVETSEPAPLAHREIQPALLARLEIQHAPLARREVEPIIAPVAAAVDTSAWVRLGVRVGLAVGLRYVVSRALRRLASTKTRPAFGAAKGRR